MAAIELLTIGETEEVVIEVSHHKSYYSSYSRNHVEDTAKSREEEIPSCNL